jgi:hypothetical protein
MAKNSTAPPAQPLPLVPPSASKRWWRVRHARWVAYAWGAVILGSLLLVTPFALGSIGNQLIDPPEQQVYHLMGSSTPNRQAAGEGSYLNISVVGLDETKKLATLRVSGDRVCHSVCPAFTLRFFGLSDQSVHQAGLPPSATITVGEGSTVVSESVQLPVSGIPNRYPFDYYELLFATSAVPQDGQAGAAPLPTASGDDVTMTLASNLPNFSLLPPAVDHSANVSASDLPPATQHVAKLRFSRPTYIEILTVLLVVLMMAAALLTAITEPLRRLVVGIGSVLVGVWGVRAILVADAPPTITAVDLLLSVAVLILLYGVAIRVLLVVRRVGWDGLMDAIGHG